MRKVLYVILAIALVFGLTGMAAAIPSTSGVTLERLTNPQAGPGEPDGIKPWGTDSPAYPFRGDRWNSYIWTMQCFTPKTECCETGEPALYVGTNRNVLYSMFLELYLSYLEDQFTIEEFDWIINKLFCGNIPTGYADCGDCIDKDFRAQIWKWPLCNGPWEKVYTSDAKDYNCCGEYESCFEEYLNREHPLCCSSEWMLGPDWGFRGVAVYTPTDMECFDAGQGEYCCAWPRIIFGGSRSFAGLGGFETGIPPVDHLRAIGLGHPGYDPEEVFCDPYENGSLRTLTTYKASACEDPECCELPDYDHLVIGSESNLYITNDLRDYTEIADVHEHFLGGDIFDALQYGNYLYVVVGTYEGSGFTLWRGKPGNVCANPITASFESDCDDCPEIFNECDWEWEALVACDEGELYGDARYPSGFGITNHGAASLAVCNDCLYIGTFNMSAMTSFGDFDGDSALLEMESTLAKQAADNEVVQLVASDEDVPESIRLEPLRADFLFNFLGDAMHSLLNVYMEFDKIQGTKVYRYCAAECGGTEKWDLVAGAPTSWFPGGAISNVQGDGFSEDPNSPTKWNVYTWRMICCDNKLYATTYDVTAKLNGITECWCEEEGTFAAILDCLDVEIRDKLCCVLEKLKESFAKDNNNNPLGFDMYRLENPGAVAGLQWSMITQDGFGDKYNYGGRTLECCDCDGENCVFVGTANPFWGGQVWKVCPATEAEVVERSGEIDCVGWTLQITPSVVGGEVDGELVATENPSGEGEMGFFVNLVLSGDIADAELCVDLGDCTEGVYDAFFLWTGSEWQKILDLTDPSFCADVTGLDGTTWGLGDGQTFPVGDDDDDDDGNGTPGGDEPTSSSSGGCNVGTGAAILLLLVPLGVLWFRRF